MNKKEKGTVIAICGKICSGKTYYAQKLKQEQNTVQDAVHFASYLAVILSCDELTKTLFNNDLGNNHEQMLELIKKFYKKQSVDIVNAGCNVILDWGFWQKKERDELTEFYKSKKINLLWHYIDVTDKQWQLNIQKRNELVKNGTEESSYFLNEGLLQKLLSTWEEPSKDEIDVWYTEK